MDWRWILVQAVGAALVWYFAAARSRSSMQSYADDLRRAAREMSLQSQQLSSVREAAKESKKESQRRALELKTLNDRVAALSEDKHKLVAERDRAREEADKLRSKVAELTEQLAKADVKREALEKEVATAGLVRLELQSRLRTDESQRLSALNRLRQPGLVPPLSPPLEVQQTERALSPLAKSPSESMLLHLHPDLGVSDDDDDDVREAQENVRNLGERIERMWKRRESELGRGGHVIPMVRLGKAAVSTQLSLGGEGEGYGNVRNLQTAQNVAREVGNAPSEGGEAQDVRAEGNGETSLARLGHSGETQVDEGRPNAGSRQDDGQHCDDADVALEGSRIVKAEVKYVVADIVADVVSANPAAPRESLDSSLGSASGGLGSEMTKDEDPGNIKNDAPEGFIANGGAPSKYSEEPSVEHSGYLQVESVVADVVTNAVAVQSAREQSMMNGDTTAPATSLVEETVGNVIAGIVTDTAERSNQSGSYGTAVDATSIGTEGETQAVFVGSHGKNISSSVTERQLLPSSERDSEVAIESGLETGVDGDTQVMNRETSIRRETDLSALETSPHLAPDIEGNLHGGKENATNVEQGSEPDVVIEPGNLEPEMLGFAERRISELRLDQAVRNGRSSRDDIVISGSQDSLSLDRSPWHDTLNPVFQVGSGSVSIAGVLQPSLTREKGIRSATGHKRD